MDKTFLAGVKLAACREERISLAMSGALVKDTLAFAKLARGRGQGLTAKEAWPTSGQVQEGAGRLLSWGKKAPTQKHKIMVTRANGRTADGVGYSTTHRANDDPDKLRKELQAMGMKFAAVIGKRPIVLTKTKEKDLLSWQARERTGGTNPLESTNLERVAYNPGRQTLTVEFRKGGLYRYNDVPPDKVADLLKAESHGKYFHQNIKTPEHAYKRLI